MTIARRSGALTAVMAWLFATIPLATGAVANAAENPCWTTKRVNLENKGVWTYGYWVRWCADGTDIVSVAPTLTYEVLDPACDWAGSLKETLTPTADGTGKTVFNLSAFRCPADIGKDGVNPWVILNLYPDGTYKVDQTGIRP